MARKSSTEADRPAQSSVHYKVLARRWRPQQFDDLIGQEAISQALKGAITAGRVAHAYLFTGARGVGKTSAARILAKALNCQTGPTCTPCDKCDPCESIASGDDVDVLEIDGASNRGIDEVRELRQNANLRPTRTRYKIYIIDEVHMLTREAFNALLKTLEEPPEHVKFIFATTDPQKIPVTILSRCQRFDFGTIGHERIRDRLEQIVKAEGIAVDDEVLELVTRRAAGSMRDALSLLDQLLAFGGERVRAEQVHRLLGTADEDRLTGLVTCLIEHRAGAAIEVVDQAEAQGVQLGELLDQLIEHFRDLMVAKSAGASARLVSVSSRQRERVVEQARALPLDYLLAAADILAEAKIRLRGSSHGRVLVDIALVRIAALEDLAPLDELVDRLAALEGRSEAATAPRPVPPAPHTAPAAAGSDSKKNFAVDQPPPVMSAGGAAAGPSRPAFAVPDPLTAESAAELLREMSAGLSPLVQQSLARAKLTVGPAPATLVVLLDPLYNNAERARELQAALDQRVGLALRIRVELGVGADRAVKDEPPRRSTYSERLSDASRDGLVQQAIDVFGARVIRVDEG